MQKERQGGWVGGGGADFIDTWEYTAYLGTRGQPATPRKLMWRVWMLPWVYIIDTPIQMA